MKMRGWPARAVAALALAGAGLAQAQQATGQADFVPVTDAMIQNPDPADWLSWRRTLDSWGYSPLDQITTGNVDGLRLVWVRPLEPGHQEGTPLVHDGRMYFPGPSDMITALIEGTVRTRALYLAQTDSARAAIEAALAEGISRFPEVEDGYAVPMPAIIGWGSR